MTACVHRWQIETVARGGRFVGVCTRCHKRGSWPVAPETTTHRAVIAHHRPNRAQKAARGL